MIRDLAAMAEKDFDLIVIGGGATGAFIAWDAALRGFKIGLLEKRDFASATSAASTKLVHGGLRYLKSLELSLVRESLRERRILSIVAPHLVHVMPFLLPLRGAGWRGRLTLEAGLVLYDLLAYDSGFLDDPEKRHPRHEFASAAKVLSLEPVLSAPELEGAFLYSDGHMLAPERLAMEALLGATEHGALIANDAEVTGFHRDGDRIAAVDVMDGETGRSHKIRARLFVNATGAAGDEVMRLATGRAPRVIVRSKGIHIVTPALSRAHALAIPVRDRHLFVIPWRGHSLIGTTDAPYDGPLNAIVPTREEVVELIGTVNEALPGAGMTIGAVRHAYAGLRPLVGEEGAGLQSTYARSRRAEIVDHEAEDKIRGLVSAIGGKWTTSRHIAEKVVDLVQAKLSVRAAQSATRSTPLPGGQTGRFSSFLESARRRWPMIDPRVVDHLAHYYGARMGDVIAAAEGDAAQLEAVSDVTPEPLAAVRHAMRREMAHHLEDVLMRRTGLGTLGRPDDRILERVADMMARERRWTPARKVTEIDRAMARFPVFN